MSTSKVAAPVAEKTPFNVKTVALDAKQSALFLLPDLAEHQSLAVIDTAVLKYLTALLPSASYWEIAANFRTKAKECNNLKELVACAKDFVVFHESVNLLERFFDPTTEVVMDAPFNVVKEKTFEEKMADAGYLMNEVGNWVHAGDTDQFINMMIDNHYDKDGDTWYKRDIEAVVDKIEEVVNIRPQVVE